MGGVRQRTILWSALLLSALLVLVVAAAAATPGALDPAFGTGGKVTTQIRPGSKDDEIDGLALQPDGKIVAAGYTWDGSNNDYALARYNPNGSLDSSFGSGGKVALASPDQEWFNGVTLQPDGKIVAVGRATSGTHAAFGLARFNANGTLDTSFGSGGLVATPVGASNSTAEGVAIQASGKIVAAGYAAGGGGYTFALVRYNANGSLDTSFGSGGMVTTSFGTYASAYGLVLQPDGKIVAAGYTSTSAGEDFALARYNPNGSLDTSFGTGGKVMTDLGPTGYSTGWKPALQADGKIVVAGRTEVNTSPYEFAFALARYNANGSLDTGFGTGGKVITSFGGTYEGAYEILVQPNGKLVAAGYSRQPTTPAYYEFALARYTAGGALDTTFGTGGKVLTLIKSANDSYADDAVLQPDGKIVAGGATNTNSNYVFALARYQGDSNTLRVKFTGSGKGSVASKPIGLDCTSTCSAQFASASQVSLAVTPKAGSDLSFGGACSGHPHVKASCTVTMNGDQEAIVKFSVCTVPKLKGRPLKGARRALHKAGCSLGKVKKQYSGKVRKGRVSAQKPGSGKKRPFGYRVKVRLSKGPKH